MSRLRTRPRFAPIGPLEAFLRFLRDPTAPMSGKLFLLFVVVYVVLPADLIADSRPFIGLMDDLGFAAVAAAYAARVIAKYQDDSTYNG
jgi:uncharacterized membrane protein YkvA (DUF1232 family)